MSQNLTGFPTESFFGTPYSQAIKIGSKPIIPTGPQTVRLDISWADYGAGLAKPRLGVFCNLTAQGQVTGSILDAVRSVYIDNTYVPVPVYVKFPDTLFTIVCPAYSVVMSPAFTNVQQFTIYAEGFTGSELPVTSVFVSNIDRQGYYIPAALTGEPTTPIVLQYQAVNYNSTPGNYTINNVPIGADDPNRLVVAVVTVGANPGFGLIPGAFVMGGSPTTLAVSSTGNSTLKSYIFYANVAAGTTMNVSVQATAGAQNTGIRCAFYTILNATSLVPVGSGQSSAGGNSTIAANLSANENGVVLAGAIRQNDTSFSWQNVAQDQAGVNFVSGNIFGSSASILTNIDGSVNVTANACSLVAASFA